MTIFRFAVIRSLRRVFTLSVVCIVPVFMIFIRPLWKGADAAGPVLYGLVILYSAFLVVRTVMTDRITGTIVRIYAAPVTSLGYLVQNLLAAMLMISAQIVLVTATGAILYGWTVASAFGLLVCYTVFGACAVGFSLAWISLFRSRDLSDGIFSAATSFMAILGGIFVPLPMLPDVFVKVGMLFPTYWFSSAVLRARGGAESGYGYGISLAMLTLFTVAFLAFGSTRRLE